MRLNSESNLGVRIEILQGENSLSGQPGPSGVGWRTKLLEAKVRWFLHHFVEGKQARSCLRLRHWRDQHPAAIASSQPRGLFWNRKSMRRLTARLLLLLVVTGFST